MVFEDRDLHVGEFCADGFCRQCMLWMGEVIGVGEPTYAGERNEAQRDVGANAILCPVEDGTNTQIVLGKSEVFKCF